VGWPIPRRSLVVEALCRGLRAGGLPEAALPPRPRRPLYSRGARKAKAFAGFFDAIQTVRAASKQAVPSQPCRRQFAMARPSVMARATATPMPTARPTGRPRPTCRRPCKGKCSGSPAPWVGEGPSGPGLRATARRPTGRRSRKQREQIEISSAAARRPPAAALALQRQAVAEGERLDRLGSVLGRDRTTTPRQGSGAGSPSLLWALAPSAPTPEGGLVIHVAEASEAAKRLEGGTGRCSKPLRQPQLPEIAPDQPEQLAALLEPGANASMGGGAATLSARAADHFAAGSRPSRP